MIEHPLKILVGADVPPDPNSGAAGTVYYTNQAFKVLGHEVDEIWAEDLGRRIQHGNLHYLLELPGRYRDVVAQRCALKDYDIIQLSQPHAWLAARDHQKRHRPGVFINRSHGFEPLADQAVDEWRKRLGCPENRFPRNVLSPLLKKGLERHIEKIANYSDGFVVPGQDIQTYLNKQLGVPLSRIGVIPHGVHQSYLTTPIKLFDATRHKRLLYVGQFAFIKAPHILAKVFSEILRREPDVEVTWVCSALDHATARDLLDPKIRQRVRFLDWMGQEELLNVFDEHGLFFFPSFYEGAGKASAEAMVRGLCVIASDVGAMRDHIDNGVNGFLCQTGDVRSMVNVAENLLNRFEYAHEISANAAESVKNLTWESCAASIVAFARQLLTKKQGV